MMERDFYLGRILTGRISSGIIHVGDKIHALRNTENGFEKIEEGKVCYCYVSQFLLGCSLCLLMPDDATFVRCLMFNYG